MKEYDGKVDLNSEEYPGLLKEINDPPKQLYYRGKWDPDLFEYCLAVVGTRRITRYGRNMTDLIVSDVANAGITVVSGFMYGVDAYAHAAAINGGGKTIAVMPCGIDTILPVYQKELYLKIIKTGGLIVSEYNPGVRVRNGMFVKRNRIVAGLSQATLVVEGAKKSGTMITAALTLDYNRFLFAVPGHATSTYSQGPNFLIKQGAYTACCANDILETYELSLSQKRTHINQQNKFSTTEQKIIEQLKCEPLEIDEISRRTKLSSSETAGTVSMLQLNGVVEEDRGKLFIKS